MKNTEQDITDLIRQKLENHESHVDPGLWNGIESSLPSASTAVAAKTGMALLKWVAASVAVITTAVVIYNTVLSSEEVTENKPATTVETTTPGSEQPSEINTESPAVNSSTETGTIQPNNRVHHEVIESPGETVIEYNGDRNDPDPATENENELPGSVSQQAAPGALPAQPSEETSSDNGSGPASSNFNANFEIVRVSEDDLKFFFIPNYPDESKYSWTLGNTGIGNEISASYTFEEGVHEITLSVTGKDGEIKTHTETLEAWYPAVLVVPNVFSPNSSDSKNSCLDVMAKSKNVVVEQITIFDRNGRELFVSSPGNLCWDGNDKYGNPANEGTYMWVTRFHDHSGKVEDKKGTLTLLRN